MNNWIGNYTYIGMDAFRIDWVSQDGSRVGLSQYDDASMTRVVGSEAIRRVLNLVQLSREQKRIKQDGFARKHLYAPQTQVERMLDDGSISEEDVTLALELHGYGGLYGDEERVPESVWATVLADILALLKLRAHMAAEQKKLDREAAKMMH